MSFIRPLQKRALKLRFSFQKRRRFIPFFILVLLLPFQNCTPPKIHIPEEINSSVSPVGAGGVSNPGTNPGTQQPGQGSDPTAGNPPPLVDNENAVRLAATDFLGIKESQIFQRQDNGEALIKVSLRVQLPTDISQYKISLLAAGSEAIDRVLITSKRGTKSEFSFSVATGLSSRRVRFSFYDVKGIEQRRWISPSFAVGEVFLVSGQSNSSNHGEVNTQSTNPLNRAVNPLSKSWVTLQDPLPYASNYAMPPWNNPSIASGSPWPSFADDLSRDLKVPVAIISVGWGGSGLSWWKPGYNPDYFTRLVYGAQSVPDCGFRAVLWHQGESDAMGLTSGAEYESSFRTVVDSFRSATGCSQPWMVARVSYLHHRYWKDQYRLSDDDTAKKKWDQEVNLRAAQNRIGQWSGYLRGPDTDLVVAKRYRHDDLHFSSLGLQLHGKLWSHKIKKFLGASYAQEYELVSEVKSVYQLYQTVLNRTAEHMEADVEGLRFWVEKLSLGVTTLATIEQTFRNSDEYFIRGVYAQYFQRQPTWSEVIKWTQAASSGAYPNRASLQDAIIRSK